MDNERMSHIAYVAWGICDNTLDLAQIWNSAPWRRREFGEAEIKLLSEAHLRLGLLLSAVQMKNAA